MYLSRDHKLEKSMTYLELLKEGDDSFILFNSYEGLLLHQLMLAVRLNYKNN